MIKTINRRIISVLLTFVMLLSFFNNLLLSDYSMKVKAASIVLSEKIWEQAAKDGCYDGFFHYAVQEYLTSLTNGYNFEKELQIKYNQLVFNPVSKKNTTYGKVDIYKQINANTYHIWEVKPVSYNNAKKRN